jgi:hypothetical protein
MFITKQFFDMPTYPDSIRRSSNLSTGEIPFSEFLVELPPAVPTQPNASYGYDRVVNITRFPHELLSLKQSLSLEGFSHFRIWKHAMLECWGNS